MATKSQHASRYREVPAFLRLMRKEAGLTQRQLARRLARPQSWVFNCESANRRIDIAEFLAWADACEVDAVVAFRRFIRRSKGADV